MYFSYGEKEIAHLKACDRVLGAAVEAVDAANAGATLQREVTPDLFEALVQAVVGQQISGKAQASILGRMHALLGTPFTAEAVHAVPDATLQACGLSFRKVAYLKGAAAAVCSKALNLDAMRTLDDAAFCRALSTLKGVGLWTAEMLLIFSLQRPNVMSFGDLAVQRALRMLYRHKRITPQLFEKYRKRYSPYGTVACLYLWAVAGGALAHLTDPADTAARKKASRKPVAGKKGGKAAAVIAAPGPRNIGKSS